MKRFLFILVFTGFALAEVIANQKIGNVSYGEKDKVLYSLDAGMVNYWNEDYESAIENLSEAEDLIDEYYTKSITQNTAAFLTNDSLLDYPGEDYEDIYLNLFKAIAYYKNGQWEEGFHELNAYKRKSNFLKDKYAGEIEKAKAAANLSDNKSNKSESVAFYDSALAEYLFMLYYRQIQDKNQVAFANRMLKDVYKNSSDIYDFAIPSSVDSEANVNASDTRLNFIIFSGIEAQKIEKTEYYSNELILSLPELVIPSSNVNLIKVTVTDKKSGKIYNQTLEQIENLGNVSVDIFKNRSKLIYYKSLARSLTKGSVTAGTSVAGDILSDSSNAALSTLGTALSVSSMANENATYKTEHADTRHSKYFPGRADVGGLTLEPGLYDITISYINLAKNKEIYKEKMTDVKVEKGKLNLVSASSTLQELKDNKKELQKIAAKKVSVYDNVDEDKFYFDLGTEPEAAASSTYGLLQYNWSQNFASNIKLKYSTSTVTSDFVEGYTNATRIDKSKEFEVNLLPLIYNKPISQSKLSFSLGLSYQYIDEDTFAGMFDTNGFMLDICDEGKYFTMSNEKNAHIFAPRLGFNARLPIGQSFSLNFDFYSNPIYFINLSQTMRYHSDQTVNPFDYSGSNQVSRWSKPYLEAKLYADCFNFVRLVSQFSYQKLDFQQMGWAEDFESLKGYDDVQNITKLRFGLEFLVGNKKRARARGGIYYEKQWNSSSYTKSTVNSDKWIVSIGTER